MARPQSKYKMSFYNVFHQDGNSQYIWNTNSNALINLDISTQNYIRSFCGVDDGSAEFMLMKDNGFIVYEQLNEFGRICVEEKQSLFAHNTTDLWFTIAPGLGCNYCCGYCFESNSNRSGVMTLEIATEVAEYICNQIRNNHYVNHLTVEWFGGEPLLYLDAIKIISRVLMEYTQKNNIEYTPSIVTNGRFLNVQTLALLSELCINDVYITIDGMRDLYCKSKGASPNDFDCVIDNICNIADKVRPSIRLNIPDNDADEAIITTDFLLKQCNLKGRVRLSFAQVIDYSLQPDSSQQLYEKYADNLLRWTHYVIEEYGISEIEHMFCGQRLARCGLVNTRSVLIGPHGELYKCHRSPGVDSMIIGNIWEDRFYNDVEFAFYTTVDDPTKIKCSQCEYLPVCMGGCQANRVSNFINFNCGTRKATLLKLRLLEEKRIRMN